MDWEAIGAIGELAGAIAVVVTLIYLSIQLRINTGALRNAASAQQASTFIELTRNAYENPVVTRLILKLQSAETTDSLSDEEAVKASFFFLSHLKAGEHNHLQHLGGHLSDEEWRTIEMQAPLFVDSFPVFKEFWNAGLREQFAPSYASFWDSILSEYQKSEIPISKLVGMNVRRRKTDSNVE